MSPEEGAVTLTDEEICVALAAIALCGNLEFEFDHYVYELVPHHLRWRRGNESVRDYYFRRVRLPSGEPVHATLGSYRIEVLRDALARAGVVRLREGGCFAPLSERDAAAVYTWATRGGAEKVGGPARQEP